MHSSFFHWQAHTIFLPTLPPPTFIEPFQPLTLFLLFLVGSRKQISVARSFLLNNNHRQSSCLSTTPNDHVWTYAAAPRRHAYARARSRHPHTDPVAPGHEAHARPTTYSRADRDHQEVPGRGAEELPGQDRGAGREGRRPGPRGLATCPAADAAAASSHDGACPGSAAGRTTAAAAAAGGRPARWSGTAAGPASCWSAPAGRRRAAHHPGPSQPGGHRHGELLAWPGAQASHLYPQRRAQGDVQRYEASL